MHLPTSSNSSEPPCFVELLVLQSFWVRRAAGFCRVVGSEELPGSPRQPQSGLSSQAAPLEILVDHNSRGDVDSADRDVFGGSGGELGGKSSSLVSRAKHA